MMDTTPISIQAATEQDYATLCQLFDEVDAWHREHLPHLFQAPNGPAREQAYFAGLIADSTNGLFIAKVDGKAVGFVHAIARHSPDLPILVPRHYVIVDSLGVSSAYQHQGIGRLLMEKACAWARANGASDIELNVYEFNTGALAFYEALGYQTLSRKMSMPLTDPSPRRAAT
jgi:ribosomal protein S18 acetylase RimI-like enzyme